jgi:hypothetical protein
MLSSYLLNPILLGLFLVVGLVLLVKGADWAYLSRHRDRCRFGSRQRVSRLAFALQQEALYQPLGRSSSSGIVRRLPDI